jgi:hypothetical protein
LNLPESFSLVIKLPIWEQVKKHEKLDKYIDLLHSIEMQLFIYSCNSMSVALSVLLFHIQNNPE